MEKSLLSTRLHKEPVKGAGATTHHPTGCLPQTRSSSQAVCVCVGGDSTPEVSEDTARGRRMVSVTEAACSHPSPFPSGHSALRNLRPALIRSKVSSPLLKDTAL